MSSFFNNGYNNNSSDEQSQVFDDIKRSRKNSIFLVVIIIAIYFIYSFFFQSNPNCQGSTTGRTPLESGKCATLAEFIFGDSEYSKGDDNLLEQYMVDFFSSTGVQPVLYDNTGHELMNEAELNAFAKEFYYGDMFPGDATPDEGHFLLVFQADGGSYLAAYHVGEDAGTVLDADAMNTFMSNLDSYFKNDSKKGTEKLALTYLDSHKTIMGTSTSTTFLIIAVVAVLVIYGGFTTWRNVKKNNKNRSENGEE